MGNYLQSYAELEVHRRMVSDGPRTDSFADAIREVVQPGDVVLDIGTGTGVLAMLAARAGAKHVYAVDASNVARIAIDLVAANGFADKVEVIYGDARDLEIPEKANVIISEWLGCFGLVEDMLVDVLHARDRLLAPGGWMLPVNMRVMLAPIDDPVLYSHTGPGFWRNRVHGLDFSSLENTELRQGIAGQVVIEPGSLLSPGAVLVNLADLRVDSAADQWTSGEVEYEIQRDGVLNGFAGWFTTQLSPTILLDTGPDEPETHWRQTYLPFPPRLLTRGSRLKVAWETAPHPENRRDVDLTVRIDDYELHYTIT
jgi:SAM-dependent methyltransferase